jgi:hypothetical protein
MRYEIHPSARKHGIADDDMLHAIEHVLAVFDYEDDDRVLHIGPDRAANLLEIITIDFGDDTEMVIHAMAMQSKYEPMLRGLGEPDA